MTCLVLVRHLSFSQTDGFKKAANERENNRWEGVESVQVGSRFEMLAFHLERLAAYKSGDNLQITFFNPAQDQAIITARTIINHPVKYKMEVKQDNWASGQQVFTPWHVDEVLVPNGIAAGNLGVLIQASSKTILPASVTTVGTNITNRSNYKVYFRTPTKITSLKYDVVATDGTVVFSDSVEDEEAQSAFYIPFVMPAEAAGGIYKLKIAIVWNTKNTYSKEYTFYHQKN